MIKVKSLQFGLLIFNLILIFKFVITFRSLCPHTRWCCWSRTENSESYDAHFLVWQHCIWKLTNGSGYATCPSLVSSLLHNLSKRSGICSLKLLIKVRSYPIFKLFCPCVMQSLSSVILRIFVARKTILRKIHLKDCVLRNKPLLIHNTSCSLGPNGQLKCWSAAREFHWSTSIWLSLEFGIDVLFGIGAWVNIFLALKKHTF
jgi:hypothetical protein